MDFRYSTNLNKKSFKSCEFLNFIRDSPTKTEQVSKLPVFRFVANLLKGENTESGKEGLTDRLSVGGKNARTESPVNIIGNNSTNTCGVKLGDIKVGEINESIAKSEVSESIFIEKYKMVLDDDEKTCRETEIKYEYSVLKGKRSKRVRFKVLVDCVVFEKNENLMNC